MKRGLGALLLIVVAVSILAHCVVGKRRGPIESLGIGPTPIPQEYRDYVISCLALGEITPPIESLDDAHLDAIVSLIAPVFHAYERADFGSFVALRAGDLEFARGEQAHRLGELRGFVRELGIPEPEIPRDWLGALSAFWSAYYDQPPVERFVPESLRVALHIGRPILRSSGQWDRSFESIRDRKSGFTIEQRLMVPHRASLEEIIGAGGALTWIDVDAGFETREAVVGRLVARFVWDEINGEWFLHRAATIYDGGQGPTGRCHLIL